jgi:hypothetical protein
VNTTVISKPRATRVTWSAQERAEWLRLFQQSGQTAAEFCRDNGLSPATLSVWRQQLPEASEGSLVEIPQGASGVSVPTPGTRVVAVTLPSGLRFDIPSGIDMTWFGQLLQALADARI